MDKHTHFCGQPTILGQPPEFPGHINTTKLIPVVTPQLNLMTVYCMKSSNKKCAHEGKV